MSLLHTLRQKINNGISCSVCSERDHSIFNGGMQQKGIIQSSITTWYKCQNFLNTCSDIQTLAFTRPKAGREVGPLNWTQEHKSIWDGPASKATGHGPRPKARARLVRAEVGQSAGVRADRRPLRSPALVACVDFLKIGHFAPFSEFLHIKGLNFPEVFYQFTSTYDPYKPRNVSWKLVCTFLRNPEDRQTYIHTRARARTQTRKLYIYRHIILTAGIMGQSGLKRDRVNWPTEDPWRRCSMTSWTDDQLRSTMNIITSLININHPQFTLTVSIRHARPSLHGPWGKSLLVFLLSVGRRRSLPLDHRNS